MSEKRRDRTKAVAVLVVGLVGFLLALVIGYNYFELLHGVAAGLIILAIVAFIAYELWWKSDTDATP